MSASIAGAHLCKLWTPILNCFVVEGEVGSVNVDVDLIEYSVEYETRKTRQWKAFGEVVVVEALLSCDVDFVKGALDDDAPRCGSRLVELLPAGEAIRSNVRERQPCRVASCQAPMVTRGGCCLEYRRSGPISDCKVICLKEFNQFHTFQCGTRPNPNWCGALNTQVRPT